MVWNSWGFLVLPFYSSHAQAKKDYEVLKSDKVFSLTWAFRCQSHYPWSTSRARWNRWGLLDLPSGWAKFAVNIEVWVFILSGTLHDHSFNRLLEMGCLSLLKCSGCGIRSDTTWGEGYPDLSWKLDNETHMSFISWEQKITLLWLWNSKGCIKSSKT